MKTPTLADVRRAQPDWFSKSNRRFFGDTGYAVRKSNAGYYWLVRRTSKWSDMFGQPKTHEYAINPLDMNTLEIKSLVQGEFKTKESVSQWLRQH